MNQEQQKEFKKIKKGIDQDVRLVAPFLNEDTPLSPYAEELFAYEASETHKQRQQDFSRAIQAEIARIFSPEVAEQVNINWDKSLKLNIVDHHNILNHPILISTNIIGNIHRLPEENPQDIIVLSDSGVPMNNFFHKRGVKFCGQQLNIFPHSSRHQMSYRKPHLDVFDFVQASKNKELSNEHLKFLQHIQDKLKQLIDEKKEEELFHDQITRMNHALWPEMFQKDIRKNIPNLFYISNESIATKLFLEKYFEDDENIFTQIIFNPNIRSAAKKVFMDVTGCWDEDEKRGTFLFWGVDKKHRAVQLQEEHGNLVSIDSDKNFSIPLTKEAISKALKEKTIYPGMFLVYGISMFYCGIRPLVGFGSMNYQTHIRTQWKAFYEQIGDQKEAELVANIPTNGFIGGPIATYTWNTQKSDYEPMYALDIIFRGGITKQYLEKLKSMPFSALLQPALLDIYDIYVRPEHKEKINLKEPDLMGDIFAWLKNTPI